MKRALLYWHTLRHLRPAQFWWRARARLPRRAPHPAPPPSRRIAQAALVLAQHEPSLLGPNEVEFLGVRGSLSDPSSWNEPLRDKLWLYNCHYFDDVRARGASSRASWHRELMSRWIAENPVGDGNGWEPYPVSLRISNWVAWACAGNDVDSAWLASLATQTRWLSDRLEWHLLGNHVIANAKALAIAGGFFDGPEADAWLRRGLSILADEINDQVLADGGHAERSPMYHALVLEDLLEVVAVMQAFGLPRPVWAETVLPRMFAWLRAMTHPDGDIALFNDAAFGIARRPADLEEMAGHLGITAPPPPVASIVALRATGYARLSVGDAVVIIDVGDVGPDHQPGHAHADTLSFELSLRGRRVVVDSGTSRYGTGPERSRQRGTSAHNTVVVDGADSSEVWGGFRVARRARGRLIITGASEGAAFATGQHDGYRRLPGVGVHTRDWRSDHAGLDIHDRIGGRGRHRVEIALHLAPGLVAVRHDREVAVVDATGAPVMRIAMPARLATAVESCTVHPKFGVDESASRISASGEIELPFDGTSRIRWS